MDSSRSPSPRYERSSRHSRSTSIRPHRVRSPNRSENGSPQYRESRPRQTYRRGGGFAGGSRDNPQPSRVIGVFNLSKYTTERQLSHAFEKFGDIEKIDLVYDRPTGQSRGFGFIYFANVDDARAAKEEMSGEELDGHKLRVDYSVTKRAHDPTPGVYMGIKGEGGGYRGRRASGYTGRYNGHTSPHYRHRSPAGLRNTSPHRGRFRRSPSRSPRGRQGQRSNRRRSPERFSRRFQSRSRSGTPVH